MADILEEARRELVASYDTVEFPFRELFLQMFQIEDGTELCNLHKMTLPERAPLSLALMHGFTVAGYKCPKSWNRARMRKKDRLKKFVGTRAFQNFQRVLAKFVDTVVCPLIGDPSGVVYQSPPTFRVQLPSNTPMGIPHKDADYDCHVDTEINIWVPVTEVWGTNTLYVESKPGAGDFHPLQLSYGELCRFWGNQCHHYTVANQTDSTRVSFDLRVIPRSLYTGAFAGHIGDYPTGISRGPHGNESEQLFQRGLEFLKDGICKDDMGIDISENGAGSCVVSPVSPVPIAATFDELLKAAEFLSAAAEMGHIAAEGLCWEHGFGKTVDPTRAVACLTLDAEQGHVGAQHLLACALWRRSEGDAASTEARSAVRWWRKAGNRGHAGALHCLRQLGPAVTRATSSSKQVADADAVEAKEAGLIDQSILLPISAEGGEYGENKATGI